MYPGRTTIVLVEAILDGVAPGTDMTPYIDAANELVSEKCATVFPGVMEQLDSAGLPIYTPESGGFVYSDHRLELIERWLGAHFYAIFDPRSVVEKAGSVLQQIQSRVDLGLNLTHYGQTAMRLDTQGALAVMNNGMNKYAKMPAALVQAPIGLGYLGTRPRRSPQFGGGWLPG
jgi:hypothetical protein